MTRQQLKMFAFIRHAQARIQYGHINNQAWQFESGRRASVNLIVERHSLGVISRQVRQ